MNGDYPSFRRDLGIYLKIVGGDPEMVETFTLVFLAGKDVPLG